MCSLKSVACILPWVFIASITRAQNDREFRATVQSYLKQLDEKQSDRAAILAIDESLTNYLRTALQADTESFYGSYNTLSWRLKVATAPDNNVRIWSWQDRTKDSLSFGGTVAEFRTASGIRTGRRPRTADVPMDGCDTLMLARCVDNFKHPFTYYIGVFSYPAERGYRHRQVQLYRFEGDQFIRQKTGFENFSAPRDQQEFHTIDLYYRVPTATKAKDIETVKLASAKQYSDFDYNVLLVPTINDRHEIDSTSDRYEEQEGTFFKGSLTYYPMPGTSVADLRHTLKEAKATIGRFVDSNGKPGHYEDSLSNLNSWVSDYLRVTLPRLPETISAQKNEILDADPYPFIRVATSPDQRMRIWSWDTWTGGSMPEIENIVEYRSPAGIQVVDLQRDFGWSARDRGGNVTFDTIFQLTPPRGLTIYFPRGYWKADGRHWGSQLNVFQIDGPLLSTDVKVFPSNDTLDRSFESELSFGCEDCRVPSIEMGSNAVFIQHIDGTSGDKDILTSDFEKYEFDGEHFIYIGILKR